MNFIISLLKGIALGAGAILPGVSSGVLCVIFGIYEKLIDCILGIFKNFKQNFLFLLPFVIGGVIGVILFGNGLNFLFLNYEIPMKMLFIGLIVGCIPRTCKIFYFSFLFALLILFTYSLFSWIAYDINTIKLFL